jgi:hypothetical protein
MDRQKHTAITTFGVDTQSREKIQAGDLLNSIKEHAAFNATSSKMQSAIIKGKWDGGLQWLGLALEVGLNEIYFRTAYSYLCDYSHSSYAAALQVGQAGREAQGQMSMSMLGVMNLCMAKFAAVHARCFESGRNMLVEALPAAALKKWDISCERLEAVYRKPTV